MKYLKDNIDHYMQKMKIKKYSDLLMLIASELGFDGNNRYDFVKNEKSNFSKMLKGERPLKYEFIIPLEKIFGVSLSKLFNEEAYKMPPEIENISYNKGIQYYAYKDNPKLYKELNFLLTTDGKPIFTMCDEFGNSFLDYVVKFHSINAVKYLYDNYKIKLKWWYNQFELINKQGHLSCNSQNSIEFARLVATLNDSDLFYNIFDSYFMFFATGYYSLNGCIFCQSDFLEIILDNDCLFDALFKSKEYTYTLSNINKSKLETSVNFIKYDLINPIINNCLRYSLQHLNKYRNRAIDILKFAINYNKEVLKEVDNNNRYISTELGMIGNFNITKFYGLIIFVDVEVKDEEINQLISKLPKLKNMAK